MKVEWRTCFRIAVSTFLLFLAIHYWAEWIEISTLLFHAAKPLLIGCIMAYLVNILMSVYEKYYFMHSKSPFVRKSKRIVCMSLAILTLIGMICLLINMVIPELVSCIRLLCMELPDVWNQVFRVIGEYEGFSAVNLEEFETTVMSVDWNELLSKGLKLLSSGIGGMLGTVIATASSLISAVVTGVISGIFAIYLLIGKEKLGRQCSHLMKVYLPPEWSRKIHIIFNVLNSSFQRFIVGQCVEAIILGGLCTCGMLLLRFPYATMVGVLVGFTALIPVAGAYIGAGVGAFMILTVSPVQAAGFLVYIIILQQLEGNIIYPRVVGSSIGLPGVWVLAAVTIGGGLFGIGGMLIGVPMTAAIYQLLRMDIERRETK